MTKLVLTTMCGVFIGAFAYELVLRHRASLVKKPQQTPSAAAAR